LKEAQGERLDIAVLGGGHGCYASVAQWTGLPVPLCAGHLAIGSAIVGRDLYTEGRTFENLCLAKLTPASLKEMLHEGVSMLS
jgi:hypothetical protein